MKRIVFAVTNILFLAVFVSACFQSDENTVVNVENSSVTVVDDNQVSIYGSGLEFEELVHNANNIAIVKSIR